MADYALGSGHHATTFVTVLDLEKPTVFEHRLTYYTEDQRLDITPGHREEDPKAGFTTLGCELNPKTASSASAVTRPSSRLTARARSTRRP